MLRCSIVPLPQSEPNLDARRSSSDIVPSPAEELDDDKTMRPTSVLAPKSEHPPRDDSDPYDAITVVAKTTPPLPALDALPEELYAPFAEAEAPADQEPDSVTLRPWQSSVAPKGE
ncbi:MAG: hypothetical protein JNL38_23130 [Myxococcales bacterium]|nr:hypothetical protein [Myxococcales bacterium]